MTKQKLNRIGYITAIGTFAIATFIMYAHYSGFKGPNYERYGLLFIPTAFVINLSVLIFILIVANKNNLKGPFRSIYAMLFNIPVAFFYLWFAIYLMRYYRVTVINDTSSSITDIHLSGCDNKSIQKLEPKESRTVWIELDRDCSLTISYLDKNKNKNLDIVAGYLCSGMGQTDNFHISGKNNPKY